MFTDQQKINKKVYTQKYAQTLKGKSIFKQSSYFKIDRKKGYENNLTKEYLRTIIGTPCTYCGYPSTGVDRLNNKIGHIIDNCVPCCKECNVARMDNFTHEEMKLIGVTIRQIKDNRENI